MKRKVHNFKERRDNVRPHSERNVHRCNIFTLKKGHTPVEQVKKKKDKWKQQQCDGWHQKP